MPLSSDPAPAVNAHTFKNKTVYKFGKVLTVLPAVKTSRVAAFCIREFRTIKIIIADTSKTGFDLHLLSNKVLTCFETDFFELQTLGHGKLRFQVLCQIIARRVISASIVCREVRLWAQSSTNKNKHPYENNPYYKPIHPYTFISIHPSVHPSTHPSIHGCTNTSTIHPYLDRYVNMQICKYLNLCMY